MFRESHNCAQRFNDHGVERSRTHISYLFIFDFLAKERGQRADFGNCEWNNNTLECVIATVCPIIERLFGSSIDYISLPTLRYGCKQTIFK